MRNTLKLLLTSAAMAIAAPALAVPTITSAAVTGPTGTVWDTTKNSFYTLFISASNGAYVNPNDNFSGLTLSDMVENAYDYPLTGDGFPTGSPAKGSPVAPNSDPIYALTLQLQEGATTHTLSGTYTPLTGVFVSTSSPAAFSSGIYSLTQFTWARSLSNVVGAYSSNRNYNSTTNPGSGFDYLGDFTITAGAVPEPATWGMMIAGFGAVGATLRTRRKAKLAIA